MSNIPENQIGDWLKKLERESWQLELLVSAFTIFLLIAAGREFKEYINDLQYRYNISSGTLSFIYLFLNLVQKSIQALTVCLVGHLMLRGFWIGTIGLRSVQSSIDFSKLNYNTFFTDKLKKKVISLDRMVVKLDEICSVIFAFAFLVISILMAFGLYLLLMASVVVFLQTLVEITPDWMNESVGIASIIIAFTLLFTGIIYMLDYFTLGFFKKIKWLAKIYYPFYRFYNFITIAVLSRSIYYYMISKFSKKKIRWIYAIGGTIMFFSLLIEFDQHQYYPDATNDLFAPVNSYDNLRPEGDYVYGVSIASNYIDKPHFQVFFRYDVADNALIKTHCEDFEPMKADGLNWSLSFSTTDQGFNITGADYSGENSKRLLSCQSAIYQISINDSIYQDLKFHFYEHPAREQKGLLATIPTESFLDGENNLMVKKINLDSVGAQTLTDLANVPFWYREQ